MRNPVYSSNIYHFYIYLRTSITKALDKVCSVWTRRAKSVDPEILARGSGGGAEKANDFEDLSAK